MFKSCINLVKDIDTQKREVVFAFSKFNEYDSDNDFTLPKAFKKTMEEQGPNGADRIAHLYNHEKKVLPPIGKILKMWEDNEYAYAQSKMLGSTLANDVLDGYVQGALKEHSYWGHTYNYSPNEKGGNLLKEIRLREVSTVIWGSQERAKLVSIQKGELSDLSEFKKELEDLITYVRKSKASDEFLLDIENEILKASEVFETLEKAGRVKAPEPSKPLELTLGEIYKLKTF